MCGTIFRLQIFFRGITLQAIDYGHAHLFAPPVFVRDRFNLDTLLDDGVDEFSNGVVFWTLRVGIK